MLNLYQLLHLSCYHRINEEYEEKTNFEFFINKFPPVSSNFYKNDPKDHFISLSSLVNPNNAFLLG